ncbi:MAG: plasmid mobilization protein [Sphingobacteriales bacterium]
MNLLFSGAEMVLETKKKTSFPLAEKENKNKGGAPRKAIKRELDIRVRLSATERFMMDAKAKTAGIQTSDWVRAAIKSARVVPRLQAEELSFLRMLAGLANNLNQLMKLAYRNGLLSVAGKCRDLLSEIDQTLKSINNDDRQDRDR